MPWRNTTSRWGIITIILHWLTAVSVIGLFALGYWMTGLSYYHDWYRAAPDIHKSLGLIMLFITLTRIIWRLCNGTPLPPSTHSKAEKILGSLMHILLYGLILIIVISGYLISTADGRAISVFGLFDIPAIITAIPNQADIAGMVHWYVALLLIGFASLHASAALKHHIIDNDQTLNRMLNIGEKP